MCIQPFFPFTLEIRKLNVYAKISNNKKREDDASTLISILNTLNVHIRLLKVPELGGYLNLTDIFVGPGCLALEEYFETQYFNISLISNSILELDK